MGDFVATEKKAVSVYLDRDLYARIERHSVAEARSVSNLIERTLSMAFPVEGKRHSLVAPRKGK